MRRLVLRVALACALALACVAPTAHALTDDASLSPAENARLMRGEVIVRPETITRDGRRYVGGVTYSIVEATRADLDAALDDVNAYRAILPRTKDARLVGHDGGDALVELRQGNALVEATYTVRVRKVDGGREYRFWLDPRRPHGIEDAWAFVRVEPLAQVAPGVPRSLLTYGVLVDVGDGLVRDLFEERIRATALSVPQRVRDYARRIAASRRPRA
jgi:hypothetical protein